MRFFGAKHTNKAAPLVILGLGVVFASYSGAGGTGAAGRMFAESVGPGMFAETVEPNMYAESTEPNMYAETAE